MQWNRLMGRSVGQAVLLVGVSLLSGCALWEMIQSQNTPTDVPADPAAPAPAAPATAQPTESPFAVFTTPPLQPPAAAPVRENYGCITTNYFSDIVWQEDQPQMSLGRKPAEASLRGAPANVTSNADGSFTYAAGGEATYYTRVYPDRTCLIQVVNPATGAPVLEEAGSLGELVLAQ